MEVHVCLNNCEGGLFLVPDNMVQYHHPEMNPRVEHDLEKQILEEFVNAKFIEVNEEMQLAETAHFLFRMYTEEAVEEVIWVQELEKVSAHR